MYEFMREFAALEPQPPELHSLFRTVHGNQATMDGQSTSEAVLN